VSFDTATCTGKDWIKHASARMPTGNHGLCGNGDLDQGNCCALGAPEQSICSMSLDTATFTSEHQIKLASGGMPIGNHVPHNSMYTPASA